MLDLKLPNTSEPQAERCQILLNHFRCLPLAGNIFDLMSRKKKK